MKILHYALGFPPYRRGGLTKYCVDLMVEQRKQGHEVGMLWPGEMGLLLNRKPIVKKHDTICIDHVEVQSFEVQGVLPVPLMEGINDPVRYMRDIPKEAFEKFVLHHRPDIVHFHTLMGFPFSYFRVLKECGFKTIFTSHDYFGVCPKTTFMQNGCTCQGDDFCINCITCNEEAMPIWKIRIIQSALYRNWKDSVGIKRLRKRHLENRENQMAAGDGSKKRTGKRNEPSANTYVKLRMYYQKMFQNFDMIHYNSNNTKSIYEKYIKVSKGTVVSISHKDIIKHEKEKRLHNPLHITYLGSAAHYKGYYLLKNACKRLEKYGLPFELHVYFTEAKHQNYLVSHMPYLYSEIGNVMSNADVVVVPSLCYETFGFVVQEALSYGVPVIVSENVGSKDLIEDGKNGFVVEPTEEALTEVLVKILRSPHILYDMNVNIISNFEPKTVSVHAKEIIRLYEQLLDERVKGITQQL